MTLISQLPLSVRRTLALRSITTREKVERISRGRVVYWGLFRGTIAFSSVVVKFDKMCLKQLAGLPPRKITRDQNGFVRTMSREAKAIARLSRRRRGQFKDVFARTEIFHEFLIQEKCRPISGVRHYRYQEELDQLQDVCYQLNINDFHSDNAGLNRKGRIVIVDAGAHDWESFDNGSEEPGGFEHRYKLHSPKRQIYVSGQDWG